MPPRHVYAKWNLVRILLSAEFILEFGLLTRNMSYVSLGIFTPAEKKILDLVDLLTYLENWKLESDDSNLKLC